jgi:hypothetical protein
MLEFKKHHTSVVSEIPPDCGISWREQWRQRKITQFATPKYESPHQFWHKPENVQRYLSHISGEFSCRVTRQITEMHIPAGSRVLDIGAGPGTLAVPLACSGCQVTAIEPSLCMREAMQSYALDSGVQNLIIIPRRWEDICLCDLDGPFDFVIASYSLTMIDIAETLRNMDAVCDGMVNLFWFLTPSAWMQAKMDLWPQLYRTAYPGEPMADCLWQVLNETGIHANLIVEPTDPPVSFRSYEDAVSEFCHRLSVSTPEHQLVIQNYLQKNLRTDGSEYLFGGTTRSVRIWWQTR